MAEENERDYHIRRARQELDLAFRAEGRDAAFAHLRLSSFHMNSLRAQPSLGTQPDLDKDLSWMGTFAEVRRKCAMEQA